MAKKNVVIFDGEDKFINPKKAVYSKTRGQAKDVDSFKSVRAALEDEVGTNEGAGAGSMYVEPQAPQQEPTASVAPSKSVYEAPQRFTPSIAAPVDVPSPSEIASAISSALPSVASREPIRNTGMPDIGTSTVTRDTVYSPVYDDRKSTMPVYEAPVESVFSPITREVAPIYNAPVPQLPTPVIDDRKSTMPVYEAPVQSVYNPIFQETAPISSPVSRTPTRPTPPSDWENPDTGSGYKGVQKPIFDDRLPNDGIPTDRLPIYTPTPYQPNPVYTAPVPILPNPTIPPSTIILPDPITPPSAIVLPDPMGGGGSPVMSSPEIPRPRCPKGFVFNETTGMCIDKQNPDTEIDPIVTRTTTSSTTTTTTKAKAAAETTTTSSTTTTTTKAVNKVCSPPIYTAPKFYKWVDKGNCAYELVVDSTQLKDAAPAPVLPATGVPLINVLPTGGLGTIPLSTSTTVQTTTKSLLPLGDDGGGSAGGGGGGSPFPEEPAPMEAPKKNYFWWYVGGALAIFLIMKRKNKQ